LGLLTYVAPGDLLDRFFLPRHDLGNHADVQTGDIKLGRRCSTQVVEMPVTIVPFRRSLRALDGGRATARGPRFSSSAGRDRGGAYGSAVENRKKVVVNRDDRFAPMIALAGSHNDRAVLNVRPGQTDQITLPQTGMCCEISGESDASASLSLAIVLLVEESLPSLNRIKSFRKNPSRGRCDGLFCLEAALVCGE
jgi:hypothetical protein